MLHSTKIVSLEACSPDPRIIAQTAARVRRGAVVVFPTHGLYGLGADAFNDDAVARIFAIKRRDAGKPLLVLIDHMRMLERVALPVDERLRALMQSFWPGHVTFVVPACAGLPPGLTDGSGKVGVRWTAHPVAAALVHALGGPLTGTSANISGGGGCASISELDPAVMQLADIILDTGHLAGGPGSTVVDVCGPSPIILRRGSVDPQAILDRFNSWLPS